MPENFRTSDRLPLKTKLAYGLGASTDMWGSWMYPAVAYAVFNIYLGVPPLFIGLALTIIRLFDAFSDPLMGWISDNTRTRWGRRRPYILVAGILVGLCLPLLFLVPESWQGQEFMGVPALFWFMIGSNLLFVPLVSVANISYQSLGAELTPDYDERSRVMAYRQGFQKIFEVAFFLALPFTNLAFFTLPDGGGQDMVSAVFIYCAILGSFIILASITVFFNIKERYYGKVVGQERINITESIYRTLKCRPFRWQLLYGLTFNFGVSVVASLGYYTTVYYVCGGNTETGNNWNGLMGFSYMLGGVVSAPLVGYLATRFGKQTCAICVGIFGIFIYASTWVLYNPDVPYLQLLASAGTAATGSGLWILFGSFGADVIDYDELESGKRREGAFIAAGSYILKLGGSFGFFIAGILLQATGFNVEFESQHPESIFAIRFALATIPIAGLSLSLLCIWRYPITRGMGLDIRKKLEDRRGTV